MPEPIFMKLGMYIMTPEPISTAYFIDPSHQSLIGNGLVNNYRGNEYTCNNRKVVGCVVFYVIRAVLREVGD
jgi:hypothetical protein